MVEFAARCGALSKEQLAFFYALRHWLDTGLLVTGSEIPNAVQQWCGVSISERTAYDGLSMLRCNLKMASKMGVTAPGVQTVTLNP